MSVQRVTTRRVSLPDDLPPLERSDFGRGWFRPASLVETLTQRNGCEDIYTVDLAGPVQTATGKDHATNRGKGQYGYEWKGLPVTDLPDWAGGYLRGPVVLAREEAGR